MAIFKQLDDKVCELHSRFSKGLWKMTGCKKILLCTKVSMVFHAIFACPTANPKADAHDSSAQGLINFEVNHVHCKRDMPWFQKSKG